MTDSFKVFMSNNINRYIKGNHLLVENYYRSTSTDNRKVKLNFLREITNKISVRLTVLEGVKTNRPFQN